MSLITFLRSLKNIAHKTTKCINLSVLIIIKVYKIYISPLLPQTCRFTPTCSSYALQAFRKYNFFYATYLSTKRILKCHPFHPGGYDPLK